MPVNYVCEVCSYSTPRKSSYIDHLDSKRHKTTSECTTMVVSKNETQYKSDVQCRYCKKYIPYLRNKFRHEAKCTKKDVYHIQKKLEEKETSETVLKEENKKLETELHSSKQLLETELGKAQDRLDELTEVKEDYFDLLKRIAKTKTKSNSINMYYVINNFDTAYNYEDIMKLPLTEEEIAVMSELDPLAGSIHLIKHRCLNSNIAIDKRPIHCLDTSRDKYMLRTKNKWVVDHKARGIFAAASPLIYQQYMLDPTNPNYSVDTVMRNQQLLLTMESKEGQRLLIKELNDRAYIKNIKLDDIPKKTK